MTTKVDPRLLQDLDELTNDTSPGSGDYLLAWSSGDGYKRTQVTALPTGGGGEANTASNLGAGEGVFAQKDGIDLEFKSLVEGTNITITSDADTITITAAGGSGGAVDSVNTQTGDVVLDPDDLDDTSTTNKFTTAADISKLAGIEASADVTDATNVQAALTSAGLTATITELNYTDGVTSAIQTQIDAKAPTANPTFTGAVTLSENASIALDPAGSADGKYTGITVTGTGGATIAFGDLVTLDKDDSRWEPVDISVAAAATGDARGIIGIAASSSTDGGAITVLLNGIIRADTAFPSLTIGAPVYASTTGDVVVTQPTTTDHVIRIVGFGLTADEMYFNPSNDYTTHT